MKAAVIGLGIALTISILAPFIASPNPDGLESAAEKVAPKELLEEGPEFSSPFSDYLIPSLGESGRSEAVAIISGTLIVFGLGFGIGKVLKTNRN